MSDSDGKYNNPDMKPSSSPPNKKSRFDSTEATGVSSQMYSSYPPSSSFIYKSLTHHASLSSSFYYPAPVPPPKLTLYPVTPYSTGKEYHASSPPNFLLPPPPPPPPPSQLAAWDQPFTCKGKNSDIHPYHNSINKPVSFSFDTTTTKERRHRKQPHELLSESQKKANHIASEQRRRYNIRAGFDKLIDVVPSLDQENRSEAFILQKSVDHIRYLISMKNELKNQVRDLQETLGEIHYEEDSSEDDMYT